MTLLHTYLDRMVAALGAGGPWPFFIALALLPCIGVPTSVFSLTAGTLFRARMGIVGVVAATLGASLVNIVICFYLGRGALRPVLQRFMEKRGHKLPEVKSGDANDVILMTRVSPLPFFVKNYLLGMANVPLGSLLLICLIVEGIYTAGFVVFGDALLHGQGRMILLGASVIVIAIAGTHLARKHVHKKGAAAKTG